MCDIKPIQLAIEALLQFGINNQLLEPCDKMWVRNRIFSFLQVPSNAINSELFDMLDPAYDSCKTATPMLDVLINDKHTSDVRDRMEAGIMNLLMPRPSEIHEKFFHKYSDKPADATDYFYQLCQTCNYIQVDRIQKNIGWSIDTPYGELEITINLSKPEKDPRDIAMASTKPASNYPKCLLCVENAGFDGTHSHPARQNLRTIPLTLNSEKWHFQYSPYVYYDEHCIVFNECHTPMQINKQTFCKLVEFVDGFPHYFIGSNADLPIVGGSILSHDHFQGGRHNFPLNNAKSYAMYQHHKYPGVSIAQLKWPLSVIRLTAVANTNECKQQQIELADYILQCWRKYTDIDAGIHAFSGDVPHNTITPVVRINKDGLPEMDLVLRNNRTTDEYPLGIFHPHAEWHHIKKENIGLIEVMGLAILPGRLDKMISEVSKLLTGSLTSGNDSLLLPHKPWVDELLNKHGNKNEPEKAEQILKNEVGQVFLNVLIDCGVFKDTEKGQEQFKRFIEDFCQNTKS